MALFVHSTFTVRFQRGLFDMALANCVSPKMALNERLIMPILGLEFTQSGTYENNTQELNICCCLPACLFPTDWYSSVRRILNIAPYAHTYKPALHAVSYDKHTDIHAWNIIYRTHENLPKPIFSSWQPFLFYWQTFSLQLCVNM